MADAQLKKLEGERDRLQAELKILSEAISTREACDDLIKSVEKAPEPLASDNHKDNPWAATASQGGCCVVM